MSKIGDVIVKMLLKSDDYEKGLQRSKKATQDFSKSITKGFTAGIGKVTALVAAIAGIAKTLDKVANANQTFGDKWHSFTSGLKGAWDEFARSVASWDFSHLFSRLSDASAAARELYGAMDAMGEIMTAYNIGSAKQAKHLAELRVAMNNKNLDLDTRIEKAREYLNIMEQLESLPLRGLSRVSDKTIEKTMKQMGISFDGLTKKQVAEAKESFISFFEWLGTAEGQAYNDGLVAAMKSRGNALNRMFENNAKKQPGYQGDTDNAVDRWLQNRKAHDAGKVAGGAQWFDWLYQYNEKVSDTDRTALEDAVVNYFKAEAAFDETTRRVQTLLNNLLYERDKPAKPTAEELKAEKAKKQAAELRAAVSEIKDIPFEVNQAAKAIKMPDVITDEWVKRNKERADEFLAQLEDFRQKVESIQKSFGAAIDRGIVNSIDILTEAIGSGEEIDGGAVVKALLSPLADACIEAGLLIMTTGKGVEALRDSLATGLATGGISAIAAGAALMAVGAAAKVGLAAIGRGQSAGSTTTSAAAATNTTQTINSELTITVQGTLRGSDIVISGQRTLNSWAR